MIADMAASASVHAFGGIDDATQLVYYTEAPLRIDTATRDDADDVVHVEVGEVGMLHGVVAARATSRAETSTDVSGWTPYP